MSGEVVLRIAGDAERYRQELEKIPGMTATQAKKAADAWQRSQNIAAAQVAAGIRRSGEDAAKAWAEVGKKVGTLAGGPFATIADVVTELVPKAGAASSAVGGIAVAGGAVAGVAVALGAVTMAAFELAGAAVEAEKRLADAGRAAEIPPSAREGVRAYTAATTELSQATDLLVVTLGGELGGALAVVVRGAASAIETIAELYGTVYRAQSAVEALGAALDLVSRGALAAMTLGASELIRYVVGIGDAAEQTAERVTAATRAQTDAWIEELDAEDRRRMESARAGERLLEERRKAEARAADERRRDAVAAARKQLADEARAQEEAIAAATSADRDYYTERARIQAEASETMSAAAERSLEIDAERAVAGLSALGREVDALLVEVTETARVQTQAIEDSWGVMGDSIGAVGEISGIVSDAMLANGEKLTKAQKRQAIEYARASKAIAITVATLSAIEAIAKAVASAPPPFNVPAIVSATAAGAVQVARAISTKIPSLFSGGRDRGDGEGLALLHKGESVINARATDAIVRALNQGLSPLGRMTTAGGGMADVYLDGRAVGRAMRRAQRAGRWAGGPPPGYVRRGR